MGAGASSGHTKTETAAADVIVAADNVEAALLAAVNVGLPAESLFKERVANISPTPYPLSSPVFTTQA